MLNQIEKLQYFLSGSILIVVLIIYLFIGMPDSKAIVRVEKRTPDREIHTERRQRDTVANESGAPSAKRPRDEALKKKVNAALTNLRIRSTSRPITVEDWGIDEATLDYLTKPANWVSELDKAGHITHRDKNGRVTSIEITDIQPGSHFETFGLENGDRVLLLDQEITEFDPSQAHLYKARFSDAVDRLRNNGKASITILRKGKPVHMEFSLDDLK